MIGKTVKGRSFKGCISYVLGDKNAKILASEGVLETDVDRKFSYSKLNMQLGENSLVQWQVRQAPAPDIGGSLTGNIVSATANVLSGAAEVAAGIGALFDIQPSGGDVDDAEYLRQEALKKKKKPQKRRGID